MIFKSEEPKIQRMTAEASRVETDPGRPFDYRKELTDEIKTGMKDSLTRSESSVNAQDYMRLATYMRALNVPIPSPNEITLEMRVRDFAASVLQRWQRDTKKFMSGNQTGLMLTVQFDKSILVKTPHYPELISQLKVQAQTNTLMPSGIVALRFFDPSFQPQPTGAKHAIPKLQNFHDNRKGLMHALNSLVLARLSGQISRIAFDADDWRYIHSLFADYRARKTYRNIAMLAYYIRIINAKEIRFDHNGLHIIDPESSVEPLLPSSAAKDKPTRRNI